MGDVLASMQVPTIQIRPEECVDEFPSACSVAILGVGQAGGRIADTAWSMGFRKVLAVNTSQGDLDGLEVLPADRRFAYGTGGAGKDPANGRAQFAAAAGDILDQMTQHMGRTVDLVLVVAGAGGGGTGAGAIMPAEPGGRNAFDVACGFLNGLGRERKGVGAIVTLPEPSEGPEAIAGARKTLGDLFPFPQTEIQGPATPVIVVDNARILRLWPNISIGQKWTIANRSILSPLQAFLTLAARTPAAYNFDLADLWRLLGSHRISFGAFDVAESSATSLAQAVRNGVENGMMAGGFQAGKATDAAILFAGSKATLDAVKADDFEYAARAMGSICPQATLHRGVYEVVEVEGLKVFTAIGGAHPPVWN